MTLPTVLVVNADDFGQSPAVTEGILTAHRDGIVTSTSLMVRGLAAGDAAAAARAYPGLSVGLHVDLGEWRYEAGKWHALYEVVDRKDETLTRQEIQQQLERFRALVGHDPSHLDSHQHVHQREPVQTILRETGQTLGIPVRHFSPYAYIGEFYGQMGDGRPVPGGLSEDQLVGILRKLGPGSWELACHPSAAATPSSMYSSERIEELAILTSPRIRQTITELGISLAPFRLDART